MIMKQQFPSDPMLLSGNWSVYRQKYYGVCVWERKRCCGCICLDRVCVCAYTCVDRWAAVFGRLTVECDRWCLYPTIIKRWEQRTNVCLSMWFTGGGSVAFKYHTHIFQIACTRGCQCTRWRTWTFGCCWVARGVSWQPWQMMSLSSCFKRLYSLYVDVCDWECACISVSFRVISAFRHFGPDSTRAG